MICAAEMFETAKTMTLASLSLAMSVEEQRRHRFARLYPEIPTHLIPEPLRLRS
jgi:hypothetical protein